MKRPGFSLLELILVVGIIGVIGGLSIPAYNDYQIRSDLNLATEQATQGLARAKLLSQSAQGDSGWGFYVPSGTLYKGESYETRDPSSDEVYPMPSTITMTGLTEVAYSKLDGTPSATGSITLTALNEDMRNVLITVQKESIAVVESDSLVICHKLSGNSHTLTINENAWPAHQSHGDTLGPCTVSGGSSSAASSAQASSSASTGASSSAGSTASCEDRFSVAADGTITTTGDLSVQFDSLGAQFRYGDGGPDVPVYVSYKRKTNTNKWTKLFDGDEINGDGGATQTASGFRSGDKVIVQFHASYHKYWWLSYDRKITSNDGSDAVLILRNGDDAPLIQGSEGQTGVSALLEPVTVDGKISIGQYDAVLIADFNRPDCSDNQCSDTFCSDCTGVDYQDGVVLVKFLAPSC